MVYISAVTSETPPSDKLRYIKSRRRPASVWVQHDNAKTCSACGASVARQDCHKNRFGEYICHDCQALGIGSTRRSRIWAWVSRVLRRSVWAIAGLGLTLVVLAMLILFAL